MKYLLLSILMMFSSLTMAEAIRVELVNNNGNWQLLRGGKPYYTESKQLFKEKMLYLQLYRWIQNL